MIKKILFSVIGFTISFFILSLEFNGETVFEKMYTWTSPLMKPAKQKSQELLSNGLNSTQSFGKMLFTNSNPTTEKLAPKKPAVRPQEKLSEKDRQELDSLIKNFSR